MNLVNKDVLLVMPNFENQRTEITNELLRQGANVQYIQSKVYKEDFRLHKSIMSYLYYMLNPFYRTKNTENVLKEIQGKSFDYLFVVGIYGFTPDFIDYVRKMNNNIQTIYYFWDAFVAWNFSSYIPFFDVKYTFDMVDYSRYKDLGLQYLPLYFSEHKNDVEKMYDISLVGTINPKYYKRLLLANKLKSLYSGDYNMFFWLTTTNLKERFKQRILMYLQFLFIRSYRQFMLLLKKCDNSIIHYESMKPDDWKLIEAKSKCILGISAESAGTPHRIISALSCGIKVITINPSIRTETFYSPQNICVIDWKNPVIPPGFINSPFEYVDMTNLRIDNWIETIFADN